MTDQSKHYILKITCPDTVGIVAAVSTFLAGHGAFITESSHFGDPDTKRFFMRTVFTGSGDMLPDVDEVKRRFRDIANRFHMEWDIHDADRKARVMLLVSKFDHCLNDLLYRYRIGTLPVEIRAVVSNHPDLKSLVEWHEIPFLHLPITKETKAEQEAQIREQVDALDIDLVVLARYMQVLSPEMCEFLRGRCINIHHSFLPSFKGARPYHQAHSRGVKIIGATAHYVTGDLDEGPIIEQGVERIDHKSTNEEMVAMGRDIENVVLARAVRWHVEHRVFLNGIKTVVLR